MGHFLRGGSHPIITVLDCSKAFDTCKFSTLFSKLMCTGMPAVVVRAFMHMYQQQFAWVRWGRSVSSTFSISNGTRQGSIASPALWAMHLDNLIKELRQLGVGCHVGGLFVGVVVYADDVLLMAPTRGAMQAMLSKCEDYAARHNIMFSTDADPKKSKTKCIFVTGKDRNLSKPAPLTLCDRELPWVSAATHLGHELHESGSMEHDASIKRSIFIQKSVDIRETFSFASPVEIISAFKVYCSSYYGCMLWDLGGEKAGQVFNSWTAAIKLAWGVPRGTRTYLVQQVLAPGITSAKVDILARFGGFFRSLRKSPSHEVAVMANLVGRDLRSTTGKNLALLRDSSGLDPWVFGSARLKEELDKNLTADIPPEDQWRVRYLGSLLEQRQVKHYMGDKEGALQTQGLIDSLCVN